MAEPAKAPASETPPEKGDAVQLVDPKSGQVFDVPADKAAATMRAWGMKRATADQVREYDYQKRIQAEHGSLGERVRTAGEAAARSFMNVPEGLERAAEAMLEFTHPALKKNKEGYKYMTERHFPSLVSQQARERAQANPKTTLGAQVGVGIAGAALGAGAAGVGGLALESGLAGLAGETEAAFVENRDFTAQGAMQATGMNFLLGGLGYGAARGVGRLAGALGDAGRGAAKGVGEVAENLLPKAERKAGGGLGKTVVSAYDMADMIGVVPSFVRMPVNAYRFAKTAKDLAETEIGRTVIRGGVNTAKDVARVGARQVVEGAERAWSAGAQRIRDKVAQRQAAAGMVDLGGGLKNDLGHWPVERGSINLSHADDPIAALRENGASAKTIRTVEARMQNARVPVVDVPVDAATHARMADKNKAAWSKAERDAIDAYQGEDYRDVNAWLRKGEKSGASAEARKTAETLDAALRSAVKRGDTAPGVVWRGVDLPEREIERIKQSATYRPRGVFSAATNADRARIFAPGELGNKPLLFRIEQKSGVPVVASGEDEILMRSGTRFDVVGVSREKFTGGPYSKGPTDSRYHDVVTLRESGIVAPKSGSRGAVEAGGATPTLGGIASSPLGITTGVGGAALAGAPLAARAMREDEPAADPVGARTVAALNNIATGTDRAIGKAVDGVFSRALGRKPKPTREQTKALERAAERGHTLAMTRMLGGKDEDPIEAFERKRDAISQMMGDPNALLDRMGRSWGDLPERQPGVYQAMVVQAARVVSYLSDRLPAPTGKSLLEPDGFPATLDEVEAWAGHYQGAFAPLTVFDDAAIDAAGPEALESVRANWPALHERFQRSALERLQSVRTSDEPTAPSEREYLDRILDLGGALDPMLGWPMAGLIEQANQKSGAPVSAQAPKQNNAFQTEAPERIAPRSLSSLRE